MVTLGKINDIVSLCSLVIFFLILPMTYRYQKGTKRGSQARPNITLLYLYYACGPFLEYLKKNQMSKQHFAYLFSCFFFFFVFVFLSFQLFLGLKRLLFNCFWNAPIFVLVP